MDSAPHFSIDHQTSGKNTAATLSEPVFGFCDSDESSLNNNSIRIGSDQATTEEGSKLGSTKGATTKDEIEKQVENLLNFELGFSLVMEAISKSKKPVIGHNMKFDLAFLYHQFYKELPDNFASFA